MTTVIEQNATFTAAERDTRLANQPPKLLDRVRERIRVLHYARTTEKTYIHWILGYIRFHGRRHPQDMGATEVEAYLSHLATARDVAAGTQNQAMHAILFLYKQVLGIDLPWLDGITRAKPSKRLPTVLIQAETRDLLAEVDGLPGLVINLLYGTGMRLMEGLRLRVKDIDFAGRAIVVRGGKGDKDRVVPLPESLITPLQARLAERRKIPGILTGIGITYCGYCGSAMVANNVTARTRQDGALAEGNRRLLCSCRAARRECPMPATCTAGPVERAIMTWCADQINLSALLHGQGSQASTLRKMLAGERRKLAEADGRMARLTEIMLAADAGDTPLAFVRKARELEAEREAVAVEVKAIEQRLLAAGRNQTPAAAEARAALRRGVEAMDYGARLKTRQLFAETFERIVIYSRGMSLDPAGLVVDVLLVAKGGGSRELAIDRKSGRLIEGASAQEWPPENH